MENNELSNILKNCLYINLETRPDKKNHVENQMQSIGLNSTRFNAIQHSDGAIGCTFSHIQCITLAKSNNWDNVVIVEDDITFLDPQLIKTQLQRFLSKHQSFDVLLLGGNNFPPYTTIDDTCAKVTRCQTTTGYIVNKHYYDTLIENFKQGLTLLLNNPDKRNQYACDKYWFRLQYKDNWFLLTPLSVVQKPGYSDIENKLTNYSKHMLNLDKNELFETIEMRKQQYNPLKYLNF